MLCGNCVKNTRGIFIKRIEMYFEFLVRLMSYLKSYISYIAAQYQRIIGRLWLHFVLQSVYAVVGSEIIMFMSLISYFLLRDHHGADDDHHQHPLERDVAQDPLRQGHRYVPDGLLRHGLPGPAGIRLRQLHLLREGPPDAKEASGEGGEGQQWEGQVWRGEGKLGFVAWISWCMGWRLN